MNMISMVMLGRGVYQVPTPFTPHLNPSLLPHFDIRPALLVHEHDFHGHVILGYTLQVCGRVYQVPTPPLPSPPHPTLPLDLPLPHFDIRPPLVVHEHDLHGHVILRYALQVGGRVYQVPTPPLLSPPHPTLPLGLPLLPHFDVGPPLFVHEHDFHGHVILGYTLQVCGRVYQVPTPPLPSPPHPTLPLDLPLPHFDICPALLVHEHDFHGHVILGYALQVGGRVYQVPTPPLLSPPHPTLPLGLPLLPHFDIRPALLVHEHDFHGHVILGYTLQVCRGVYKVAQTVEVRSTYEHHLVHVLQGNHVTWTKWSLVYVEDVRSLQDGK